MEGFTKIPNWAFELEPLEFVVYSHLVKVQSYREYKGDIEDGWFAKSQNELVKECGFGCHKRLTRVLEGMVKKNIVQINPTKNVTYFKLSMGKMPIPSMGETPEAEGMGKIPTPTMGKMPTPTMGKTPEDGMGKMPNLHKNSEQEYLQDINSQDIVTSSYSNSNIPEKEELKEEKEVTVTTSYGNRELRFVSELSEDELFQLLKQGTYSKLNGLDIESVISDNGNEIGRILESNGIEIFGFRDDENFQNAFINVLKSRDVHPVYFDL